MSASALVVATCEPGNGDTTDLVCGSHFIHEPSARSPTAATSVRSSGLCRQAAWITIDEATPFTTSSGPCSPTTPQSARSTVIGTPCTWSSAAQRRARLFAEVVIAAARQLDLERGGRRSEPGAEPQEVGTVATARPQVDRAQFGAARQLGQVGRGADPLDPFRFDERVEFAAPGDQTLPEVRELVAESLAPRALVLDRVGDHHERRHQREGEELHLFREREQGETGGEWSEHGEQLEPPLVAALGDRSQLGRLDGRDHRRAVRRPLELDLAELVDPLALGAHEPPERQAGATEADHVGLPGDGRLGDLAVVHRHAVLRVGQRGDRHRPVVAHGEFGVAARHGRVAEVDVRLVVAPDRVGAGHQDVARPGIGTGQRIDGDRLGRDRADRPHRTRRADDEFVAGHDAHVADRRRRFEHRPGALQRERRRDRRIRRRRERRVGPRPSCRASARARSFTVCDASTSTTRSSGSPSSGRTRRISSIGCPQCRR